MGAIHPGFPGAAGGVLTFLALRSHDQTPLELKPFVDVVERGARRFGAPLLRATSDEEMVELCEEILDGDQWWAFVNELAPLVPQNPPHLDLTIDTMMVESFFDAELSSAAAQDLVAVGVYLSLMQQSAPPLSDDLPEQPVSALDFFFDLRIPSEIKRALWAMSRGGVVWMALVASLTDDVTEERLEMLLRRLRMDIYEGLRLVASMPGSDISLDVVPSSARIDIEALNARHSAFLSDFDARRQRAAEAISAGALCVPLYPDIQ